MHPTTRRPTVAALLMACGAWFSAFLPAEAAPLRAALSVRVVTPEPLLPVSGGIGIPEPVTRKAGDLTVRALVLEEGDTRVALVSADFLGWPAVLGDRTRARVKSVAPDHLLIGATHTHSAPDPYAFPDPNGRTGADLKYLDSVAVRMAEAVEEAASRLEPVRLRTATGAVRGRIAYNAYAEALFDPRCSVLQFVGAQSGKPLATLVNYAVHPEVLGSRAGVCSPDLVGPLYDQLAARGAGTGIFFNGAQGGMVTADNRGEDGRERNTWEECQRIGHALADEALRLLEGAPTQDEPALECRSATVAFPVESPVLLAVLRGSPMGYRTDAQNRVTTRIHAIRLGDAHLITLPGEALPNVGAYLKRKMRARHNLLLGLTNDAFGYILAREDFGAFPRYEYISRTSLGEATAGILVQETLALEATLGTP